MRKEVHEKGPKSDRDRAALLQQYGQLCYTFHVKRLSDEKIAALTNRTLYQMCEDIFNKQPMRRRARFFETMYGTVKKEYRINPHAFKWWWYDYRNILHITGLRAAITFLWSPIGYFQYLKRVAELRKEKMNEPAK